MPSSHKQLLQDFVGRARNLRDSIAPSLAEGLRSQLPEDGRSAWINPVAAGIMEEVGCESIGADLQDSVDDEPALEQESYENLSDFEPVAVTDLVEEALTLLRSCLEGINLTVKLDPKLKWRVDPLVFEGVLTSLLGYIANSVPTGEGSITIRTNAERDEIHYLEVSFNGSADELMAVFGECPGRLIDSNGKLLVRPGLVATRETIQAHDGMIGVERLSGWGTNVWFTLEPVRFELSN